MNKKQEEIRIKLSKRKSILMTTIAIGFLIICSLTFFTILKLPYNFNRTFLIICFSFLILTFGFASFTGITKLFDKNYGLIINDNGIQINIGPNSGTFIQWKEIESFKIHNQIKGGKFILLFVKNPEEIIQKTKGLNRLLIRINNISHKTPLSLMSTWLDCNFEKLVMIIDNKLKKNGA